MADAIAALDLNPTEEPADVMLTDKLKVLSTFSICFVISQLFSLSILTIASYAWEDSKHSYEKASCKARGVG